MTSSKISDNNNIPYRRRLKAKLAITSLFKFSLVDVYTQIMKAAYSLVTIVLILVAGFVGYYVAKNNLTPEVITQTKTTEAPKAQTIFTTQTATIQGTISKVDGNKLSVTNLKQENGQFTVSDKVVIYKFRSGSTQASASSDLKTIETGQQVLLNLELANGAYQVVSISYLPTAR